MNKILKLGLEKDVLQLRGQGHGFCKIAEILSQKNGRKIYGQLVQSYCEKNNEPILVQQEKKGKGLLDYGEEIQEKLRSLDVELNSLLLSAKQKLKQNKGNERDVLAVINQIQKNLELLSKISGAINSNVQISPTKEFNHFQDSIINVIGKYPNVMKEVEEELFRQIEGGSK